MKTTSPLLMKRHFSILLLVSQAMLLSSPVFGADTSSIEDLKTRAGQGDMRAQVSLAVRYRDGDGVEKNPAEAMRWAHLAADKGDASAMDFVGHAYLRGSMVPRHPEIAFGYFQAGARESAQAAFNLGLCYFGAQGVAQDIAKGLEAWKSAASKGHGRAASEAAMAYLTGEGMDADPAEARRLAERAAELDDPSGLVLLGELQYQSGDLEGAKTSWGKVSQMRPVGPTGNPEQPSDQLASQQGADLLKLMDWRKRKPEPGRFAFVDAPHIHQGYNNCGSTSCAMLARFQGIDISGWNYKRLCPSPVGTGTDWGHLLEASAKIGLKWKLVTFTPDDKGFDAAAAFLKAELDAGRPVVIDFKYVGPQYPGGEAGHTLLVAGYASAEDLYILRNPALATPGLQLISAADLKRYWRSDHYGELSHNVLSRPAIVMDSR